MMNPLEPLTQHPTALADVPRWLRFFAWPLILIIVFLYAYIGCKPDDGGHDG